MGPGDTARGVQGRLESGRRRHPVGPGPRLRRELVALRGQARNWPRSSGYHDLHVSTVPISPIQTAHLRCRYLAAGSAP